MSNNLVSPTPSKRQSWFPTLEPLKTIQEMGIGAVIGLGLFKSNISYRSKLAQPQQLPSTVKPLKNPATFSPASFLASTLVFPVIEEIVFRGLMKDVTEAQRSQPIKTTEKIADMTTNSALFALSHLRFSEITRNGFRSSMRAFPFYFAAGCLFWQATEMTGNLWCSTFGHITNNALCFTPWGRKLIRKIPT